MYACMCVCMCVFMYACMHVCVYVCMYVCVYMHVCMYACKVWIKFSFKSGWQLQLIHTSNLKISTTDCRSMANLVAKVEQFNWGKRTHTGQMQITRTKSCKSAERK